MVFRSRYPYAQMAALRQQRLAVAPLLASIKKAKQNPTQFDTIPALLMQAVVVAGDTTTEGQLIESVALPWFEIIALIQKEPDTIHQLDWRKWEEIVAGAYREQGFDVILTPRSGDKGRDVIATSSLGRVRLIDQVKAYSPGHLVTADDVRAMVGALTLESNVSKAVIRTTSSFAPGVMKDPDISRMLPYRLELKPRDQLLDWLASVAARRGDS